MPAGQQDVLELTLGPQPAPQEEKHELDASTSSPSQRFASFTARLKETYLYRGAHYLRTKLYHAALWEPENKWLAEAFAIFSSAGVTITKLPAIYFITWRNVFGPFGNSLYTFGEEVTGIPGYKSFYHGLEILTGFSAALFLLHSVLKMTLDARSKFYFTYIRLAAAITEAVYLLSSLIEIKLLADIIRDNDVNTTLDWATASTRNTVYSFIGIASAWAVKELFFLTHVFPLYLLPSNLLHSILKKLDKKEVLWGQLPPIVQNLLYCQTVTNCDTATLKEHRDSLALIEKTRDQRKETFSLFANRVVNVISNNLFVGQLASLILWVAALGVSINESAFAVALVFTIGLIASTAFNVALELKRDVLTWYRDWFITATTHLVFSITIWGLIEQTNHVVNERQGFRRDPSLPPDQTYRFNVAFNMTMGFWCLWGTIYLHVHKREADKLTIKIADDVLDSWRGRYPAAQEAHARSRSVSRVHTPKGDGAQTPRNKGDGSQAALQLAFAPRVEHNPAESGTPGPKDTQATSASTRSSAGARSVVFADAAHSVSATRVEPLRHSSSDSTSEPRVPAVPVQEATTPRGAGTPRSSGFWNPRGTPAERRQGYNDDLKPAASVRSPRFRRGE